MTDKTAPATLEREVIARASQDERFRELLLANPIAAISEAFGLELAQGTQVKVMQREPNTLYLILPAPGTSGELSDAELAGVSGGTGSQSDIDSGVKRAVDL